MEEANEDGRKRSLSDCSVEGSPSQDSGASTKRVKTNKRSQSRAVENSQSAVQLCALSLFADDFIKGFTDSSLSLLSEGGLEVCNAAPAKKKHKKQALYDCPDIVDRLFSSLIDCSTEPGEWPAAEAEAEEARRGARVDRIKTDIRMALDKSIIKTLLKEKIIEEDVLQSKERESENKEIRRLQDELREVVEANNRNKKKIREKRGVFFAYFERLNLLRLIDGRIEGLYLKKHQKNKKRKKDDDGHFAELEDLLYKRNRLTELFRHIPEDFFDIPMDALDLCDVPLSEEAASGLSLFDYF